MSAIGNVELLPITEIHDDEVSQLDSRVFTFTRLPRSPVVGSGVWKHFADIAGPIADTRAVTKSVPVAVTLSITSADSGTRLAQDRDQSEPGS